jgi:hypothetical protein
MNSNIHVMTVTIMTGMVVTESVKLNLAGNVQMQASSQEMLANRHVVTAEELLFLVQ